MTVTAFSAQMCDIADIMRSVETTPIIDRLMAIKPEGLTANAWAVRAGVNRSVFSDARKRNNLTMETLERLLDAVGVSLAQFQAGQQAEPPEPTIESALSSPASPFAGQSRLDKIPVLGSVLGHDHKIDNEGAMIYVEMIEIDLGETVNFLPRPATLGMKQDVYALYVAGHSMEPRYDAGDPIFIDPHQPPAIGDDVVVQLRDGQSGRVTCALIKRLIRRSASYIELAQFNPEKTFRLPMANVAKIHRVLPRSELHR